VNLHQYLSHNEREPIPDWLSAVNRDCPVDLATGFFQSRVVFYPGSRHDGNVVRLFGGQAYGKGIVLTIYCDPQTPRLVRVDPGLLRQVLLNLVGNAVKFTDHGGVRVRLQWEGAGDGGPVMCCEVIDTGIGIAPVDQARIFEAFH
jgi:hypothetical protein